MKTASWVIINKVSGNVVIETYSKWMVDHLNISKYKAVPILEHLQSLNKGD